MNPHFQKETNVFHYDPILAEWEMTQYWHSGNFRSFITVTKSNAQFCGVEPLTADSVHHSELASQAGQGRGAGREREESVGVEAGEEQKVVKCQKWGSSANIQYPFPDLILPP